MSKTNQYFLDNTFTFIYKYKKLKKTYTFVAAHPIPRFIERGMARHPFSLWYIGTATIIKNGSRPTASFRPSSWS
jgi:hypothetical protein